MEKLFTPDFGLMVWTVVTFLLLVAILAKFAWPPILQAIKDREEALRQERVLAEKARAEAQRIQKDLEAKLAELDVKSREVLSQAQRDADALRARHSEEAKAEAVKLMEKTRAGLEEEKRRLVGELRKEVADLSVLAAERLVRKSVDAGVKKAVLDQFFHDIEKPGKR
ncbi:MAG: F0F1 ATP synthase subunit B [Elusimicrobia bacterium]|nr:F0F1 ATP synthase subunit B [Elusimicrobiota bacterium]